jgi:hypothetical protein
MSALLPTLHRFAVRGSRFAKLTGWTVKKPFQTGRSSVQIAWSVVEIWRSDSQTTRSSTQKRQSPSPIGASFPETAWPEARIAGSAVQIAASGVQTAWSKTEKVRQLLPAGRVGQACCLSRVSGAFCPWLKQAGKMPTPMETGGTPVLRTTAN